MRSPDLSQNPEEKDVHKTREWLAKTPLVAPACALLVLLCPVLGQAVQFSAGAAPAEPAVASSPASHTVDLIYQETDEVLVPGSVAVRLQSAPSQVLDNAERFGLR
jgi:hypothetical protein